MSEPAPSRTVARSTPGRWPGLVWALPAAALLIVGYLGLQALAHAGVDVVVVFDSAADAKPGDTEVVYKVTGDYDKASEAGVIWNDPDLALPWPVTPDEAVLSDKDQLLPRLKDAGTLFTY